jgi:hypothetical protein
MAAGCPVVTSDGGTIARLLRESGGGWVVPQSDAPALASVLRSMLADPAQARARAEIGRATAKSFTWSRALAPLERFCAAPAVDATRDAFAFKPETPIPADDWRFRIRRKLGALRGRLV